MALQAIYERFLASSDPQALEDDASLNYIPTLITFNKPDPITKHLASQNKLVATKKSEKVLAAVEGPSSISLDIETTFEFTGAGGGSYLPTLEGNFLADKIVTLPSIHIVHFGPEQKIKQIRVYWDQGAILKQLDVIGSRGRNWPIYDSKDQARLIRSTVSRAPSLETGTGNAQGRNPKEVVGMQRSFSPSKRHISDPHASLSLFTSQDIETPQASPAAVAPRTSGKPPPRDYNDLFAAGNDEVAKMPPPPSPTKSEASVAPKGATGNNFAPSRLFDEDPDAAKDEPARYKSDPRKYDHFEIGTEEDDTGFNKVPASPPGTKPINVRPKSVHSSHWDFEDFVTPDKPRAKPKPQEVRHFGWSDDEGELAGSPGKHPRVPQPRRDAETHFEFRDDGTPVGAKPTGRPKGQAHNTGLGLYENNLYEDSSQGKSAAADTKKPLSTLTNGINRKKDFGHSWDHADTSPVEKDKVGNENKHIAGDRMKAVKMMDASWDSYDTSPDRKTPQQPKPTRKGSEWHWAFGDADQTEPSKPAKKREQPKTFWDIE